MPNIHDDPAALKALQDQIYRENILRARAMTVEQRLAEAFKLSNEWFASAHAKALRKLNTTDEAAGWLEVRRWMKRIDQVRDRRGYVTGMTVGSGS